MKAKLDMEGKRIGRLVPTVIDHIHPVSRIAVWRCKCDCGKEVTIRRDVLNSGRVKSCGCWNIEVATLRVSTHGMSKSREYRSWVSMKSRCLDPNNHAYMNYGGRGIKVCKEWLQFEQFYRDMGCRPKGKTLDRINVNGDYDPSNCRWATVSEQLFNRRPYSKRVKLQKFSDMDIFCELKRRGFKIGRITLRDVSTEVFSLTRSRQTIIDVKQ